MSNDLSIKERADKSRSDDHKNNEKNNVKLLINKFEIVNGNTEVINPSDHHNNYLQNTTEKLEKHFKDVESSKFDPEKIQIREKPRNNLNRSNSENVKPPPLLPKPKRIINSCLIENVFKPIGFENPKKYSFLDAVVQQFYSCANFRKKLIEYHNTYNIVDSNADDEKKMFVNNFCELLDEISKRNEKKAKEYFLKIQNIFENLSLGDDVYICFMNILTVVSEITRKHNMEESTLMPTPPLDSSELSQHQNGGFVHDLFYGKLVTSLFCDKCSFEFNKSSQSFKSILLSIPNKTEIITLEQVIHTYFKGFPVDTDDKMICLCPGGSQNLYSKTEYIHLPFYLFIYLDRYPYFENGIENNTFVNCNEILYFPTGESSTKYRLISVIDHIGDNYGGHYYAKSCFESDQWWMLNDSFVNLIEDRKSIVTKQAIVFLFKKY